VVVSNVGADCNLLASPLNTKFWPIVLEEDVELEEMPDSLPGLISDHGTATCLPEDEAEAPWLDVSPDVEVDAPEFAPVLLVPPAEPLSDKIANSTRPEFGLIITSLIVPRVSPDVDFTSALVN
jgi:hypothetical protein